MFANSQSKSGCQLIMNELFGFQGAGDAGVGAAEQGAPKKRRRATTHLKGNRLPL